MQLDEVKYDFSSFNQNTFLYVFEESKYIRIMVAKLDGDKMPEVIGYMVAETDQNKDIVFVVNVSSEKGYGPLLYECMMMEASPRGLASEKTGETSSYAKAVWKKFFDRKDVRKERMDFQHWDSHKEKEDYGEFMQYAYYMEPSQAYLTVKENGKKTIANLSKKKGFNVGAEMIEDAKRYFTDKYSKANEELRNIESKKQQDRYKILTDLIDKYSVKGVIWFDEPVLSKYYGVRKEKALSSFDHDRTYFIDEDGENSKEIDTYYVEDLNLATQKIQDMAMQMNENKKPAINEVDINSYSEINDIANDIIDWLSFSLGRLGEVRDHVETYGRLIFDAIGRQSNYVPDRHQNMSDFLKNKRDIYNDINSFSCWFIRSNNLIYQIFLVKGKENLLPNFSVGSYGSANGKGGDMYIGAVLTKISQLEFPIKAFISKSKSTMVHEIKHAHDHWKRGLKIGKSKSSDEIIKTGGTRAYLNDRNEIESYFAELINDMDMEGKTFPEVYREMKDKFQKHVGGSFENLKTFNKKKLIRDLYKVWQHEQEQVMAENYIRKIVREQFEAIEEHPIEKVLFDVYGDDFLDNREKIVNDIYGYLGSSTLNWAWNNIIDDYPDLIDVSGEFLDAAKKEGYEDFSETDWDQMVASRTSDEDILGMD